MSKITHLFFIDSYFLSHPISIQLPVMVKASNLLVLSKYHNDTLHKNFFHWYLQPKPGQWHRCPTGKIQTNHPSQVIVSKYPQNPPDPWYDFLFHRCPVFRRDSRAGGRNVAKRPPVMFSRHPNRLWIPYHPSLRLAKEAYFHRHSLLSQPIPGCSDRESQKTGCFEVPRLLLVPASWIIFHLFRQAPPGQGSSTSTVPVKSREHLWQVPFELSWVPELPSPFCSAIEFDFCSIRNRWRTSLHPSLANPRGRWRRDEVYSYNAFFCTYSILYIFFPWHSGQVILSFFPSFIVLDWGIKIASYPK